MAATPGVTTLTRNTTTGTLTYSGCFADGGALGCSTPTFDSLANSAAVVVSPDGKNVYVSGGTAVTTFARNTTTGALAYSGCIANSGQFGCTSQAFGLLTGTNGLVISPDGKNVYAGVSGGGVVNTFTRDTATGVLTSTSCLASNAGIPACAQTSIASLTTTLGLAVSPDGKNVYVGGTGPLSTLTRDPATGALTFGGCLANISAPLAGCTPLPNDSVGGPYATGVSPDGTNVYAMSNTGVTWLTRDPVTGVLTYSGCLANAGTVALCTDAPVASLAGTYAIAFDPAGKNVYLAGGNSSALTTLTRNTTTGALTYVDCFANSSGGPAGCATATRNSIANPTGVVVSPDGLNVYTSAASNPAVTTFNRAQASQTITFTPPGDTSLSAGTVGVSAIASSGLPVVFTSATAGVCTVAGATVTLVATGIARSTPTRPGTGPTPLRPRSRAPSPSPQSPRPSRLPRRVMLLCRLARWPCRPPRRPLCRWCSLRPPPACAWWQVPR